jgi:UV DNA damage endonuclease
MHPEPFYALGTPRQIVLRESIRCLHYHARIFELMGMGCESIIVLHGGGVYGDKSATMRRWITRFNALPIGIKRRIAIENDERAYSIEDILTLSRSVEKYGDVKGIYRIPVILDTHHYFLYNLTLLKKKDNGEQVLGQPSLKEVIPLIVQSWQCRPKFHVSDEKPNSRFGAHDDYVKEIPKELLALKDVDIMVEAKMKEQAVLLLRKKYKYLT